MIEICWALPVMPESLQSCLQQSQLAEKYGFDAVLISSLPKGVDPWILATQIAMTTEKIRLLVAQNTNYSHPLVTCKALHTLNRMTNGRVDLNIVTGSFQPELAKYGKPLDHSARYRRTKEFIEVLRMLRTGHSSYHGEFYELDRAELFPPLLDHGSIRYFVAGSSTEAQTVASQLGDYYVMYANDRNAMRNSFQFVMNQADQLDRQISCGIFIDVIARSTDEEAWEVAERVIAKYSPIHKRLVSMYIKQSDSVGVKSHIKFLESNETRIEPHLWTGLSKVSDSVSVSIVGAYENVVQTIKQLNALGAQYLILSGSPNEDEIERIGRYVLPYVV